MNFLVEFSENLLEIVQTKLGGSLPVVLRPWGSFKTIFEEEDCALENIRLEDITENNPLEHLSTFKIKIIKVDPDKRLSLQSHRFRSEHWVIVQGNALVTIGEDDVRLERNQHIYIPKGAKHRIKNVGNIQLILVETQIGCYLGDDDIVRYSDDFGRE